MKRLLKTSRVFIIICMLGMILIPITGVVCQEINSIELLLSPSILSSELITDYFDDGIIDDKWTTFKNLNDGDSIMFIHPNLMDTSYVIQRGNAYIIEEGGILLLSDSTNEEQYDSLINLGYERKTVLDYDYAGLKRQFTGIEFDSICFRYRDYSQDSLGDSVFMSGHNYCNLYFINKSLIEQDTLILYLYQMKIANENNDHYNLFFRYFEYRYRGNGELISSITHKERKIQIWDESIINEQEYIDFIFKRKEQDIMTMKIKYGDNTEYTEETDFNKSQSYLIQINNYISPYNYDVNITNPGYISIDYIKYFNDTSSNDSSWLVIDHPSLIYACVDTTFEITVKDGRRNDWPVEGARVTISERGNIIYEGTTNYLGICNVEDFYYREEGILDIEVNKSEEQYRAYNGIINVNEKYVLEYPEDMRVLEYEDIPVILKMWDEFVWDTMKGIYIPDRLVAVEGAEIDMKNEYDVNENGLTDINGEQEFNDIKTNYTKGIDIEARYGNYHDEGTISPYMWSNVKEATGPGNGNSITRDPETGELYMVYTKNNPNPDPYVPTQLTRVIEAYSDNEGEWWYVQDIGYGKNASISLTGESEAGIFYDKGIGYVYNATTLPSPITVINGSVFVEPGSVWSNNITNYMHSSGIKYLSSLEYPYLVHAMFSHEDPSDVVEEILIGPEGMNTKEGYLVIPAHNPSIALQYNYTSEFEDKNDRLIAFEDKNSEICQIRYLSDIPDWYLPERKSFSISNKSINPHIDVYGDKTALVWQEEVMAGTDEYRIYLNGSRFIGDNTETNKLYPKVKRNRYISYVENNDINIWYYQDETSRKIHLYEGTEIYYPDFDVKTTKITTLRTRHTVYYMYNEKDGDIYKIKTGKEEFTTSNIIPPLFDMAISDTMDVTGNSPIYEYITPNNRPVERISSVIEGLNDKKYYDISVITTNNNKNEPYILMIDGEVKEVIYGKENETLIPLDNQYLDDGTITVSVDMLKGNPHRTVDIKLYEYDEISIEEEESVSIANTMLKPINVVKNIVNPFSVINKGINSDGSFRLEINIPVNDIVKLSVYDIMGREVNAKEMDMKQGKNTIELNNRDNHNNILSKGVYFIRISSSSGEYTGKLINIK